MTFPFPDEVPDWNPDPLPLWDKIVIGVMVNGSVLLFLAYIYMLCVVNPFIGVISIPIFFGVQGCWLTLMSKVLNWRK